VILSILAETGGAGVQLEQGAIAGIEQATCDSGDSEGCERLASILYDGKGVPKNRPEARRLHLKSCEAGLPVACANAAYDFRMGNGGEQNLDRAAHLNERACALGNADSSGRSLAAVGACIDAAREYMYGRAVKQDLSKALELLQPLCHRGHKMACEMHAHARKMKGSPALQRPCDSRRWSECAEAAKALWAVGPTEQTIDMAGAACKNDVNTCDVLAQMAWQIGTGWAEMPKSPKVGLEMLTYACEHQKGKACLDLSLHYRTGDWGQKDFLKMAEIDQITCSRGLAAGCFYLAWDYRDGHGVEQDQKRARDLLRQACKLNHADACYELADSYNFGQGVPQDREQAQSLYQRACSLGSSRLKCARGR
jgi:TPR repeat protein